MTGANAHCLTEGRSGRGRPLRPKFNGINRLRMSQALGLAAIVMAGSGTGNIPTVLSSTFGNSNTTSHTLVPTNTVPDEFNCIIVIPSYARFNTTQFGPCVNGFGMFTSLSDNLTISASIVYINGASSTLTSGTIYGYASGQKYAAYTTYSSYYVSISSIIFIF